MRLPPRFLFLEVNKRCNLRCQHCDFWRRDDKDRENYLSPARKSEVIAEYAALSPFGSIVICGGEPMLDLEEYFSICRDGRNNGLRVLSVVNGTRIRSSAMADRLVREGPHDISISLNAHRADLHDRTRGVKGAFAKAVAALRLLVQARDRNPDAGARIYVMGLVYGSNYGEIDAFYDFVLNDIGADKLKLNFLQPSFGQSGQTDPFFAGESDVDGRRLVDALQEADAKYGLGHNPVWRGQVGMYFESLSGIGDKEKGWNSRSGTKQHICNTYDRNIMVNHYGMARLCFSTGFRGQKLEKPGDLRAYWEGAEDIRRKMRKCNQFCGISHSVRAESSTVAGVETAAEFARKSKPFAQPDPPANFLRRVADLVGL
jgi:MoaA/NifB/PqqE/SkfB family radical SAM enzyme